MNKKVLLICCIGISMLMSGCGEVLSDLTGISDSEGNEIVSDIADNIMSGIGNAVDELGADARLIYAGSNKVFSDYSESLKKAKINNEMKKSRFYNVITSLIISDSSSYKMIASEDQSTLSSIMCRNGKYRMEINTGDGYISTSLYDDNTKNSYVYVIDDEIKEYCIDDSVDGDFFIYATSEYLNMYVMLAEGKIVNSGKESFMGKEMDFEDISLFTDYDYEDDDIKEALSFTKRYYFDDNNTMYSYDKQTDSIEITTNSIDASLSVPLTYREVSLVQFGLNSLANFYKKSDVPVQETTAPTVTEQTTQQRMNDSDFCKYEGISSDDFDFSLLFSDVDAACRKMGLPTYHPADRWCIEQRNGTLSLALYNEVKDQTTWEVLGYNVESFALNDISEYLNPALEKFVAVKEMAAYRNKPADVYDQYRTPFFDEEPNSYDRGLYFIFGNGDQMGHNLWELSMLAELNSNVSAYDADFFYRYLNENWENRGGWYFDDWPGEERYFVIGEQFEMHYDEYVRIPYSQYCFYLNHWFFQ